MDETPGLYFIALIPDDPVLTQLQRLKEEAGEVFATRAALRSPPHITLAPPFRISDQRQISQVSGLLARAASDTSPVTIRHDGWGHFGDRVLYVAVEHSNGISELYGRLRHDAVLQEYKIGFHDSFHPHITIAFRDLAPQVFPAVWSHFSSRAMTMEWQAHSLYLLYLSDRWTVIRRFPFGTALP